MEEDFYIGRYANCQADLFVKNLNQILHQYVLSINVFFLFSIMTFYPILIIHAE